MRDYVRSFLAMTLVALPAIVVALGVVELLQDSAVTSASHAILGAAFLVYVYGGPVAIVVAMAYTVIRRADRRARIGPATGIAMAAALGAIAGAATSWVAWFPIEWLTVVGALGGAVFGLVMLRWAPSVRPA